MFGRRLSGARRSLRAQARKQSNLNTLAAIAMVAIGAVAGGATTVAGAAPSGATEAQPTERAAFSGRVVRRHVRSGGLLKVNARSLRGPVSAAGLRGAVSVKIRVRRDGVRRWTTVERHSALSTKRVSLRWRAKRPGRYSVSALVSAAGKRHAEPLGRFNVYRSGHASWYGPGFYGGRTACGQTLTAGILGVAHKTLPCGTKVTFRYGGRTATARVIDRGPFIAGREWDLAPALKRKLGFGSTGTVLSTR